MSYYSIKDLENISGIQAHTIRIWEQRYDLLNPRRTRTNIRYYDDEQLRKLLNVSTLLKGGMKISEIAKLSRHEIKDKLEKYDQDIRTDNIAVLTIINQMITSGLTFNEFMFEKAFSSSLLRFGMDDTYVKVLYPMLEKAGRMWSKQDMIPAQEHFISNLVKQKLFTAIDLIPASQETEDIWVLFLPEEEEHEIGLLLSSLLLRQHGKKVIYLGQRVPYLNLKQVIGQTKPGHLHFFLVRHQSKSIIQKLIDRIKSDFPMLRVWISGSQEMEKQLILPGHFQWVKNVEHFLYII